MKYIFLNSLETFFNNKDKNVVVFAFENKKLIKKIFTIDDLIIRGHLLQKIIEEDKNFIITDINNIVKKNNAFYIDDNIEIVLNDIKEQKILLLNSNCKSYIYSKYPIENQSNIIARIGYTDEDFETYKQFNLSQRQKYHEKEQQISEAKTIEEVEAIDIEFGEKA